MAFERADQPRSVKRYPLILVLVAVVQTAAAAGTTVPDWLGGKPDTRQRSGHCALYAWFLKDADRQTGGLASQQPLARQRVINIANKLIDRHRAAPQEQYAARVKYLTFGDDAGPGHYAFELSREQLDALLNQPCEQDKWGGAPQ